MRPISRAAENGAGKRTDAAENSCRKGLDAGNEAVVEGDHAVIHQVHRASDCGECRTHDEGDRDRPVDVDAQQRRHLAVLLGGALGAAKRRLVDDDTRRPPAGRWSATTMMICFSEIEMPPKCVDVA